MPIRKKLFEVQKLKLSIDKDWKNPFTKSWYITLDNMVNILSWPCNELNILIYHQTIEWYMTTTARDLDDETFIESKFKLIESSKAQDYGSCITYAKRYNLGQIFNIITDRDDDGNAASQVIKSAAIQIK